MLRQCRAGTSVESLVGCASAYVGCVGCYDIYDRYRLRVVDKKFVFTPFVYGTLASDGSRYAHGSRMEVHSSSLKVF